MAVDAAEILTPTSVNGLPTGWTWKRLDSVCEGVFDCPHSTPLLTQDGPFIARSQDMRSGVFRTDEAGHVSDETYRERVVRAEPKYGDLLYSREGTYFGIAAEVPPGIQVCLGQRMVLLRPHANEVNFRFLRYWLNSPVMSMYAHGFRDGTVAERLNLPTIRALPVAVPPLPEQRAVAHILGTLDDKLELNRRMNETMEAMARAIFKSWFVDFDPVHAKGEGRDPGISKPLADIFPARFVGSELGEIPEGWEVGTLGTLGELAIGGDWGEDEAFAGAVEAICLRGVDLEHLRRDGRASAPRRWLKPTSLERRAMDDRDVLVAGSGAGPTGRPLWMCAGLLQALRPCVYSNFCKRIRCGSAAKAVYLDAWLHDMRASGEIWEHVNGTSVPNLDANSLLAGKEVPIPPLLVLDKYHDFVRPIWQKKYAGENDTLAALRDTLLPKLISGELRICAPENIVQARA